MTGPDPRDPRGLRDVAPLLDAWLRFGETPGPRFTIPGHKGLTGLVGTVVAGDVPLYGGLDTVKLSGGTLLRAEARAARLWGADVARFSVGGSTHGNQALALALGRPGDRVVVQRTLHRSMLLGLVLAGLEPVWALPEVDPSTGVPLGVSPTALARAFDSAPGAVAALVTEPSYVGTVGDVAGLARVAHERGAALVVDAAWGAHFGFHPALPRHALAQGADALVTSAHKTLPAWSQAAIVLARTERIDATRLDAAVEATHTTSPAGAILASTDAAVALLERDGEALLEDLLARVRRARDRLAAVPGVRVLDGAGVEAAKLVVLLPGSGADGNRVEGALADRGIPVEMADRDTLVPMVTLADDDEALDALCTGIEDAVRIGAGPPRPVVPAAAWTVVPDQVLSPRTAFFAPRTAVPFARAEGRVSAEIIAPYPPGVPVLAPGERVTPAVLDALAAARASEVRIAYAGDPSLATLSVLTDD